MGQIDIGVAGVARNVVQPSIGVGGGKSFNNQWFYWC